ncbi:hypothetical protein [Kribbella pittospori]|uniref:hypothetical protein n=1 Tax=Kribbella pittospori TaxID=722689 RepID=UPI001EDCDA68|nr:hypothetical protein [Kribbella pittospori]
MASVAAAVSPPVMMSRIALCQVLVGQPGECPGDRQLFEAQPERVDLLDVLVGQRDHLRAAVLTQYDERSSSISASRTGPRLICSAAASGSSIGVKR